MLYLGDVQAIFCILLCPATCYGKRQQSWSDLQGTCASTIEPLRSWRARHTRHDLAPSVACVATGSGIALLHERDITHEEECFIRSGSQWPVIAAGLSGFAWSCVSLRAGSSGGASCAFGLHAHTSHYSHCVVLGSPSTETCSS